MVESRLSEECFGAHPLGDCNEDRKRDNEEKSPPLQTPWEGNGCHHHCAKAGKYQKDRTGNQCLLHCFVDIMDVTSLDGSREVGEHHQQTLYLSCHPAEALTLEIL